MALCGLVASMIAIVTLVQIPIFTAIDQFEADLPTITAKDFLLRQSVRITDREGNEMFRTYDDENRLYLPFDQIPAVVRDAFVAIEDERFYTRSCIDMRGIARAAYATYVLKERQGGSTITQQLVRSMTGERDITLKRKLRELMLACDLEQAIGKQAILEQYLNRINFGGTLYGIQSASLAYFDMTVDKLDAAQASVLAAIVQRPSFYAPGGKMKQVPDRAQDVLAAMHRSGFISRTDYTQAISDLSSIAFSQPNPEEHPPLPFLFAVLNRAESVLQVHNKHSAIDYAGMTINTTIDRKVQAIADETIRDVFPGISQWTGARDIGVVILDRQSRDVLAYIGNSDWGGNVDTEWVDMVNAPRQLGSAFKPIVYAGYFENGKTDASFISDSPLQIGTLKPKNYEGGFLGRMTVRRALAWSRNIPAIRAFIDVGEDRVLELASAMGAPTPLLERNRRRQLYGSFSYGWPMAIGAAELPLYELVQAFGTIAEGGVSSPMHTITSIRSSDGQTLYLPPKTVRKQILQPKTSDMLTSILSDWSARPDRWNMVIDLPHDWNVALKTGTSNVCLARKFDGNCKSYGVLNTVAVGFTDRYVIGVIVGNANNDTLDPQADGLNAAVPVWVAIIRNLSVK